jgi:hypothetical protein
MTFSFSNFYNFPANPHLNLNNNYPPTAHPRGFFLWSEACKTVRIVENMSFIQMGFDLRVNVYHFMSSTDSALEINEDNLRSKTYDSQEKNNANIAETPVITPAIKDFLTA